MQSQELPGDRSPGELTSEVDTDQEDSTNTIQRGNVPTIVEEMGFLNLDRKLNLQSGTTGTRTRQQKGGGGEGTDAEGRKGNVGRGKSNKWRK